MKYRIRRKPTNFAVSLVTEAGERGGEVIDATPDGARLRVNTLGLVPETNVTLSFRGQRCPATIVWMNSGEAGVAFRTPLPAADLAVLLKDMRVAKTAKKKRFLMS